MAMMRVDYLIYVVSVSSLLIYSKAQDVGVDSFTIATSAGLDTALCSSQQTLTFDVDLCEISGKDATVTTLTVYYTDHGNFEEATAKTDGKVATLSGEAENILVPSDAEATHEGAVVELEAVTNCEYTHICVVITATDDKYPANDDACIELDEGGDSTSNCPAANCDEDPGTPTNGGRSGEDLTHRSELTYTCDTGYELIGEETLTCYDGNWDHEAPICVDLASGLLTITSPDDAISCTGTPTVKFDLHVCDVGGEGGTITDVEFYYMDTDTYDVDTSKRSPEHSTTLTAEVDADGDHTFSDQEVKLTDDDKCEDYSYLCAFIVVTGDTNNGNDYSCIKLDLSEISTNNCQDSGAAVIGVAKYSVLAGVIFVLASYLF